MSESKKLKWPTAAPGRLPGALWKGGRWEEMAGCLEELSGDLERELAPGLWWGEGSPPPFPFQATLAHLEEWGREEAWRRLKEAEYGAGLLALVRQVWPSQEEAFVRRLAAGRSWRDLLCDLLQMMEEADWFPVEWVAVEAAREEGPGEPGEEDALADYLYEIPLAFLGLEDEAVEFGAGREYRPWLVMRALLDEDSFLALEDGETGEEVAVNRSGLLAIVLETDFSAYPYPLSRLPDVARYVTNTTGNFILDTVSLSYFEMGGQFPGWETLPQVRAAWAAGREIWQAALDLKDAFGGARVAGLAALLQSLWEQKDGGP